MKKSTKIIMGIIAGLFFTGLVLLLVGAMAGGSSQAMEIIKNDAHIETSVGSWFIRLVTDRESDRDHNETDDYVETAGTELSDCLTEITSGDKVASLDLSMGAGEFVIRESADDKVYLADGNGLSVTTALKGDTLHLKAKPKTKRFFWGVNTIEEGKLTIYLPGKVYEEVRIEIGAGQLCLEDALSADEVTLSLGAGEITGMQICTEKLHAEVSAGSLALAGIEAKEAEIEVSAGECAIDSAAFTELSVDVAMGSAEIRVAGKEEETSYDASCSMGEVTIGESSYLHKDSDKKHNAQGEKKRHIDAECGMGEIMISFLEQ